MKVACLPKTVLLAAFGVLLCMWQPARAETVRLNPPECFTAVEPVSGHNGRERFRLVQEALAGLPPEAAGSVFYDEHTNHLLLTLCSGYMDQIIELIRKNDKAAGKAQSAGPQTASVAENGKPRAD